ARVSDEEVAVRVKRQTFRPIGSYRGKDSEIRSVRREFPDRPQIVVGFIKIPISIEHNGRRACDPGRGEESGRAARVKPGDVVPVNVGDVEHLSLGWLNADNERSQNEKGGSKNQSLH